MPATVVRIDLTAKPKAGITFASGEALTLAATFSEPVTVTPALVINPTLDLLIGGKRVAGQYVSGSGTSVLQFSYQIRDGFSQLSTIQIPTNPFSTNGMAAGGGIPNLSRISDSR